jgi:thiol:disulfide interchange protein DsbD
VATFDAAIAAAKAAHMPVMIDFGAAWCIACKELDRSTFVDAAVRAEAARFVSIKVDTTDETAALNAIQERFGVVGLPHIAFIGSDGLYLDATTQAPRYEPVTGLLKAAEFLPQLQRVH